MRLVLLVGVGVYSSSRNLVSEGLLQCQTLTGLTGSSSQLNRTLSGIINTKKEGYHDAVDSTLWMIESGGEQIDLTNNGRIISKNSLSHVQQKLQIS